MEGVANLFLQSNFVTPYTCESCMQSPPVVYCQTDKVFLCENCDSSVHNSSSFLRRHSRFAIQDVMMYVKGMKERKRQIESYEEGWMGEPSSMALREQQDAILAEKYDFAPEKWDGDGQGFSLNDVGETLPSISRASSLSGAFERDPFMPPSTESQLGGEGAFMQSFFTNTLEDAVLGLSEGGYLHDVQYQQEGREEQGRLGGSLDEDVFTQQEGEGIERTARLWPEYDESSERSRVFVSPQDLILPDDEYEKRMSSEEGASARQGLSRGGKGSEGEYYDPLKLESEKLDIIEQEETKRVKAEKSKAEKAEGVVDEVKVGSAGVNGDVAYLHSAEHRIGAYTPHERRRLLLKFREKKTKRSFTKKVKYMKRKALAENRLRIQGRFIRKEDEHLYAHLLPQ